MKKIILLILSVFCFNIYPQVSEGWNAIDTTVIPTIGGEKVALFANNYGIHLLQIIPGDQTKPVKYFRLKSTGELDEGITADGIVIDAIGKYPNLTGDENNLYAVYQKGGTIQVKKSIDGGNTWNFEAEILFTNGSTSSNGVDAAYTSEQGLHIVWSQKEGNIYKSYFIQRNNSQWLNYSQITNHPTLQSGGFPTVTTSNINGVQKAHIYINTGTGGYVSDNSGQNFSRDFNYSTWGNPIQILPTGTLSSVDRLLVTNDGWMHCFYYTRPSQSVIFEYRKKTIESSSWGSPLVIDNSIQLFNVDKIHITKTSDQMLHAFWIDLNNNYGTKHSKKSSSDISWSPMYNVTEGGVNQRMTATTSSSNDLYVVWSHNYSVPTLRYRQYDANPLAPTNLTSYLDTNPDCFRCHEGLGAGIRLDWAKNKEADLSHYIIYRSDQPGNCTSCHVTSNSFPANGSSSLTPVTVERNCPALSNGFTNFTKSKIEIETGCLSGLESTQKMIFVPIWEWNKNWWVDIMNIQENYTYYYFVTAVDVGDKESSQSNITNTYVPVGSLGKYKSGSSDNVVPKIFYLYQNYPNPFNPSTKISYSVGEEVFVTLKVYDILGQEIVTLVNESKPAGTYEVEFNASSLPSGMYIYKLQAGSFTDVKKMLLTK